MPNEILVALVGILGVVAGTVATAASKYWFEDRPRKKADEERRKLLKRMLDHPTHTWRTFDRLKHVIGADDETTKRLLLEIGARGSEDGKPLWGMISRNPFNEQQ